MPVLAEASVDHHPHRYASVADFLKIEVRPVRQSNTRQHVVSQWRAGGPLVPTRGPGPGGPDPVQRDRRGRLRGLGGVRLQDLIADHREARGSSGSQQFGLEVALVPESVPLSATRVASPR